MAGHVFWILSVNQGIVQHGIVYAIGRETGGKDALKMKIVRAEIVRGFQGLNAIDILFLQTKEK